MALIVTLSLTSVFAGAQNYIIRAMGLDTVIWLRPVMVVTGMTLLMLVMLANFLLFLWIFRVIPRHKPRNKAISRGSLLAAFGFEVIKIIMTMTLPKLAKSPSGAAFGSVIGLMVFFYFFTRLTLFCAAWIVTANYAGEDDNRQERDVSPHDAADNRYDAVGNRLGAGGNSPSDRLRAAAEFSTVAAA